MNAIVYHQYGIPEVLNRKEVEKPVPQANEILIKVHATTVTVADSRVRSFNVPLTVWLPARINLGLLKPKNTILGAELAGEVEAVGSTVTKFKKGDQIFAATLQDFGGYAEYKCLPEDGPVAIKPADISYQEAAALPIGARTALHYLKKANIQPGQKVLVYGASGSVGTYVVQLAKYFGAEVTGVCSTANLGMVKSLGADHVIDYTREDFSQGAETYDVVFEAVNKSSFADCLKVMKEDGIYMNITEPLPSLPVLWARLTTRKTIFLGENPPDTPDDLIFLRELVKTGVLKVVIDRCYPMEQIVEAHRYVDQGHKKGNVVVTVGSNHNH